MSYNIRPAVSSDSETILNFIKELASYEKLSDKVVATLDDVNNALFSNNPKSEVLMLEFEGQPAGYCLFFHNYSTFLCRYGLYIEDLYVREAFRGKGYGTALLKHVCMLAQQRNCGRVEWSCLDWNKPSIDFYLSLGAEPMTGWTIYRLNKEQIDQFVSS